MRKRSGGHARVAVEVTRGEARTLFNLVQRDFLSWTNCTGFQSGAPCNHPERLESFIEAALLPPINRQLQSFFKADAGFIS
jgi:hypothetical protein